MPEPRPRLRHALPKPVPLGRFRRVPPSIFPPLLGLLGLALAWAGAVRTFVLPAAPAQLLAGAATALALFALAAYGAKLARRPAVLAEELAILPGRAGVAAGVLGAYLTAALIGLMTPALGRALLIVALALHLGFVAVLVAVLRAGPAEQRRVTPVWHLSFTGFIVAAHAALILGWPGLAGALFWPTLVLALAIWAVSARQLAAARVPAPLRPLLAIHLAPVALFGSVLVGLGHAGAGLASGLLALAILAAGLFGGRWLLAAGPSPLWGAFTFPLSATAGLWVALHGAFGSPLTGAVAIGTLTLATLVVPPVMVMIWRDWNTGRLPARTNAAIA